MITGSRESMLPTTDLVARGASGMLRRSPFFGHRRDQLAEGHPGLDHRRHPLEGIDEVDLLHAAQVDDDGVARGGDGVAVEVGPARADRDQAGARLLGQVHELL